MNEFIPGDENYSSKDWIMDEEISINASTDKIWPWLVQMGNGRAGWYSYDWLDNLGKKSFDYVDENLQNIEIGQKISIFTVANFKENEFLTLDYSENCNMTWFLKPQNEKTILITRLRVKGPKWLLKYTLGPGHLLMQLKQFKELKKRIEKNS